MMKRMTISVGVLLVLSGMPARAGSFAENINWLSGDAFNQLGITCTYTYPDQRPMTVPRVFMVDQDTPDGTVLYSWGYGEFLSDITMSCVDSQISNSLAGTAYMPNFLISLIAVPTADTNGFQTSDSGIRLKIYARYNTGCAYAGSTEYLSSKHNSTTCMSAGSEALIYNPLPSGTVSYTITPYAAGGRMHYPSTSASVSFRAELVKQGTVSYSDALAVTYGSTYLRLGIGSGSGHTRVTDMLSGSAIQIVPPACQLKTTDYSILMNNWEPVSTTPAYGPNVPVNLALECRGAVDHVRFRFEDAGTSLSANNNVSLYDSSAGTKIDGLEIEMLYNGTKVNVDNSTLTDTGGHGSAASGLPVFDSVSTATFKARYVQNSAITRAGVNYIGPVTGKVNMYVTYD